MFVCLQLVGCLNLGDQCVCLQGKERKGCFEFSIKTDTGKRHLLRVSQILLDYMQGSLESFIILEWIEDGFEPLPSSVGRRLSLLLLIYRVFETN